MAPDDAELITRSLIYRDTAAFDELVRRYQSRVRGWLRHLSGDVGIADDMAQDTFLRAWRKLDTYKASGAFGAWLLTIARHEFLQYCRRSGREEQRRQELIAGEAATSGQAYSSIDEANHDIGRFLDVLKPEERDTMVLVYGFGLSHSEASEVSGLPLGTVKSHVRRGISKIRERFGLKVPGHD
ncbi:MAG: RNA polymerase sigma factor [Gammaproteobacteria bacterium]|nr:RNA polymerase sigma factor [Gammaproteobacteria bacterium]